jgi:hypothetical protein
VPVVPFWRRVRQRFSISAPRMAVRPHFGKRWRVALAIALLAVVAGMWWWGFDFGQIFSGFDRKEIEARMTTMQEKVASSEQQVSRLVERTTQLESDLAMAQGAQAALRKQTAEQTQENAQLKEELAFLQQLFADSNRLPDLGIQRLSVDRDGADVYRYHMLVVRGGSPRDDFEGHLTLQAVLVPAPGSPPDARSQTLTLPDDLPDNSAPLRLRFKYYQRVEGVLRVPPGLALRTLTARAYENGVGTPRATRSLANP